MSTQTPPYPPPPSPSRQAPPPWAKLSASAIVGISSGVVLLGAVLIYFVFLRPTPTPTPPTSNPVQVKVATQSTTQRPLTQSRRRVPRRPPSRTTTTPPAPPPSPGAVGLGNGITVTPAAGWTTQGAFNNHGNIAVVINHTNPYGFFFAVAQGAGSSISNVMATDINANATENGGDLSNIQVTQGQVSQIAGNPTVFNEVLEYPFTATLVTTQGSYPLVGVFVALQNSQTRNSAWVETDSDSSSDFQTDLSNVTAMLDSMVG